MQNNNDNKYVVTVSRKRKFSERNDEVYRQQYTLVGMGLVCNWCWYHPHALAMGEELPFELDIVSK
jgi:hypothetical protein